MIIDINLKPAFWGSDSDLDYNNASELCLTRIKIDITLEDTEGEGVWTKNQVLWYVPGFFVAYNVGYPSFGNVPDTGYMAQLRNVTSFPVTYNMSLKSSDIASQLKNDNSYGDVKITLNSATTATITHTFYAHADYDNYVNSKRWDNRDLWVKSNAYDTNEFSNTLPSVYKAGKELPVYIYTEFLSSNGEEFSTVFAENEIRFAASFYDVGLNNASPYFGDFQLRILDGATEVQEIQINKNYTLEISVDDTLEEPLYGYVYLFEDKTEYDNVQPMHVELPLNPMQIVEEPDPSEAAIGYPSTDWVLVGGRYVATFTIYGALVPPGLLNFVTVIGGGTLDPRTNTFLRLRVPTSNQPDSAPDINILSSVIDYKRRGGDSITNIPAIDRVRANFRINQLQYKAAMLAADIPYTPTYNFWQDLTGIVITLYDTDSDEAFFEESLINDDGEISNTSGIEATYVPTVQLFGSVEFRIPSENDQLLPDLRDRNLSVKMEFTFTYPDEEFQVVYYRDHPIETKGWDNDEQELFTELIYTDPAQDTDPGDSDPITNLCIYEGRYLRASLKYLDANPISTGKIFEVYPHIDVNPYGVKPLNNMGMDVEQFVGGSMETEEGLSIIEGQSTEFDLYGTERIGSFIIDLDQLNIEKRKYLTYFMAKQQGEDIFNCGDVYFKNEDGEIPFFKSISTPVSNKPAVIIDLFKFDMADGVVEGTVTADTSSPPAKFIVFTVGIGTNNTGGKGKFEILRNGVVVATSGMTSPNDGPFEGSNIYTGDTDWYIEDGSDPVPLRLGEFVTDSQGWFPFFDLRMIRPGGNQGHFDYIQQYIDMFDGKHQLIWVEFDDVADTNAVFTLRYIGDNNGQYPFALRHRCLTQVATPGSRQPAEVNFTSEFYWQFGPGSNPDTVFHVEYAEAGFGCIANDFDYAALFIDGQLNTPGDGGGRTKYFEQFGPFAVLSEDLAPTTYNKADSTDINWFIQRINKGCRLFSGYYTNRAKPEASGTSHNSNGQFIFQIGNVGADIYDSYFKFNSYQNHTGGPVDGEVLFTALYQILHNAVLVLDENNESGGQVFGGVEVYSDDMLTPANEVIFDHDSFGLTEGDLYVYKYTITYYPPDSDPVVRVIAAEFIAENC